MPGCSIKGCKNTNLNCKNKCISFFSFPKSEEYKAKWLKHVKDPTVNLKIARACSIHFLRSCYKPKPAYLWNTEGHIPTSTRKLLDTAVPTEYLNGEEQPEMFGTKTEWIPSDGLNKSTPSQKSQSVQFTAKSIDNIGSSHFLKDDFIIYNCVPPPEVLNKDNIDIDPLAINERIYIHPEKSKPHVVKINTTVLHTAQETITIYTPEEYDTSKQQSQNTKPQSEHLRLQQNIVLPQNEKLDIKYKKSERFKRKIEPLKEIKGVYVLKNGKLRKVQSFEM